MRTRNIIKIGAMVTILLFVVQAGAIGAYPQTSIGKEISDSISGKQYKQTNETNVIELQGSITAHFWNGSGILWTVYPTIDMNSEQTLEINTTETNDSSWEVNATLRINIKKEHTNQSFLLKKYITIFAVVMRKNKPLISGLLMDLFLGRSRQRINVLDINASDPNASLYFDVPLKYVTKEQDEQQRLFIIAVGSVLGLFLKSPPIIVIETVDLTCHYSEPISDASPPNTDINLVGNYYEGYYLGKVRVSFIASDESSSVDYTLYRYSYSYGGVAEQSGWISYSGPFEFESSGQYDIEYYSVDSVGNIELPQTATFNIK